VITHTQGTIHTTRKPQHTDSRPFQQSPALALPALSSSTAHTRCRAVSPSQRKRTDVKTSLAASQSMLYRSPVRCRVPCKVEDRREDDRHNMDFRTPVAAWALRPVDLWGRDTACGMRTQRPHASTHRRK